MTRGNQRELALQKNMKKQSDSVKGKRRDDGLSAAARKQRDSEIMQQKQKKANEKKEGGTQVALWLRVQPSCPSPVPGASPTMLAFPPVVITGPSTHGIPFALSLQRVPSVLPSRQVASLPLVHSWG
uniref:small EDRK-rich factor 1-like n=1 Tax=Jaculus jaculus TaxID=51337 RepID=UPI001E1B3DE5|nr:small EDRK-rich factor 1-like [Jaculus jaculus]